MRAGARAGERPARWWQSQESVNLNKYTFPLSGTSARGSAGRFACRSRRRLGRRPARDTAGARGCSRTVRPSATCRPGVPAGAGGSGRTQVQDRAVARAGRGAARQPAGRRLRGAVLCGGFAVRRGALQHCRDDGGENLYFTPRASALANRLLKANGGQPSTCR